MEEPFLSVASLHALVYCPRLFYLEEVERIRVADAAVFAGRRLHEEIALAEDEAGVDRETFADEDLGLRGAVDVLRRRDGALIPYEHKRGRSAGKPGAREAWQTDRVQVAAYAMLIERAYGVAVDEGRVRYHADAVTVRVPIDDILRHQVQAAIAQGRALRTSVARPPVTSNERLCVRCSLAPVCLPEETRLGADADFTPLRLLPPHPDGQTVHVLEHGASVGRSGDELKVRSRDGGETALPSAEVGQLVLHGFAQVTTQALRLCVERDIGVHWVTLGGGVIGSLAPGAAAGQRHLRQFAALSDRSVAVALARRLVLAKLESQLRYLLRAARGLEPRPEELDRAATSLRTALHGAAKAESLDALLGHEGGGAAGYFSGLCALIVPDLQDAFVLDGRSRRPPKDRTNALLSYGYGMLYREVLTAIIAVGLHPGVGFYHQPRSSAHTLALDLMELFRVAIVDMAVMAAINRRTFDPVVDFKLSPGQVMLSDTGRRKVIEVIERRKADEWRHSVVGYSLSYARMIELEVRLLEKEWSGEGGLFAKFRLR